jgi:hypothetical protein
VPQRGGQRADDDHARVRDLPAPGEGAATRGAHGRRYGPLLRGLPGADRPRRSAQLRALRLAGGGPRRGRLAPTAPAAPGGPSRQHRPQPVHGAAGPGPGPRPRRRGGEARGRHAAAAGADLWQPPGGRHRRLHPVRPHGRQGRRTWWPHLLGGGPGPVCALLPRCGQQRPRDNPGPVQALNGRQRSGFC